MDNLNSQIVNEELKIVAPEGYEIDKENSTFECIKFKKKDVKWRNSGQLVKGYWIDDDDSFFIVTENGMMTRKAARFNIINWLKYQLAKLELSGRGDDGVFFESNGLCWTFKEALNACRNDIPMEGFGNLIDDYIQVYNEKYKNNDQRRS